MLVKCINNTTYEFELIGLNDESITNNFSDCTFYIFNSNDDANKAFEYIKENLVSTIEENDNYIIGKNKNAINIVIKEFYYKTNNMIIYRTDFIGEPDSTQEILKFKKFR